MVAARNVLAVHEYCMPQLSTHEVRVPGDEGQRLPTQNKSSGSTELNLEEGGAPTLLALTAGSPRQPASTHTPATHGSTFLFGQDGNNGGYQRKYRVAAKPTNIHSTDRPTDRIGLAVPLRLEKDRAWRLHARNRIHASHFRWHRTVDSSGKLAGSYAKDPFNVAPKLRVAGHRAISRAQGEQ